MSVCLQLQYLKQITDFYKIWDEHYVVRRHASAVLLNFLQYVITLRMSKFVSWE
jgi:hypothetical protein